MCNATLLPDPDSPLRTMMRTAQWYPARPALQAPRCNALFALQLSWRAGLHGTVRTAFFLVLLDAAVELVGQQVNGRVHVLLGGVGVYRAAAHVQCRFRLLSQLLHRQHAVQVDDPV